LDVIRDRNSLYRPVANDLIENVYTLKVMNMDQNPHVYEVTVHGLEDLQLIKDQAIEAAPGSVVDVPVRLRVPLEQLSRQSSTITFQLTAQDNPQLTVTEEARFLGPMRL
ncbi:MAG: FixG Ig-like domain-containing protein, partial [Pseudomonadota bacterium]|nr:FixG Ig-like domain-containing protein [Pseudomonadota bacterium]